MMAAAKVGNTPEGAKHVDASLQAYNEAVSGLVNSLDAATPGQQDLNDSMQLITTAMSTFSVTPGSFAISGVAFSSQRATMGSANNMKDLLSAAKNLADSIGRIVATTRTAPEKAGPLMKQAASSLTSIFETFDANAVENKQLADTAKNVAEATAKMVEVLKQVVSNPKERNNQTALASVAQSTGDAIKQLMAAAKMTAPGQRECEQAIEKIQESIEDLGSASINVTVGLLDLLLTEPCTKSSQQLQVEIAR
jgi:gas vesicle protein